MAKVSADDRNAAPAPENRAVKPGTARVNAVAAKADAEPILLSIPQAAQRLGATVSAVRSLIWDGELPFVAIGQRHLVPVAAIDQWVTRNLTRNSS